MKFLHRKDSQEKVNITKNVPLYFLMTLLRYWMRFFSNQYDDIHVTTQEVQYSPFAL